MLKTKEKKKIDAETNGVHEPKGVKTSLTPKGLKPIAENLKKANAEFLKAYPGDPVDRQPVHTVYGGAHLFKSDTAQKLGVVALKSLEEYAPDYATFAREIGLLGPGVHSDAEDRLARTVYERVLEKLEKEAVEDFRIDFEDGYGNRPDAEEDGHAAQAAVQVALGMAEKTLPPFIGIRIKPFSQELHARSIRTLDIFLTTLHSQAGRLPDHFVVTIPKVTIPEQVEALAQVLKLIEGETGLAVGTIKVELMIETAQSILGEKGRAVLKKLVDAADGRCTGAHFGTYDYTAGLNITAAHQRMDHPACDFAKSVMQVTLAAGGVMLSDGATNVMPVGPHRAPEGGTLTAAQAEENRRTVHRAWKLHVDHIRHSLVTGFYQGWDLHPAQLPTRYAAVFSFFLEGLEPASARLRNFIEKAAQATLVGDVFDDAATGQGLLNYFLRGINCGAFTEKEAKGVGLTHEELQGRSFLKILEGRRGK